jgi:hypothetical protein
MTTMTIVFQPETLCLYLGWDEPLLQVFLKTQTCTAVRHILLLLLYFTSYLGTLNRYGPN